MAPYTFAKLFGVFGNFRHPSNCRAFQFCADQTRSIAIATDWDKKHVCGTTDSCQSYIGSESSPSLHCDEGPGCCGTWWWPDSCKCTPFNPPESKPGSFAETMGVFGENRAVHWWPDRSAAAVEAQCCPESNEAYRRGKKVKQILSEDSSDEPERWAIYMVTLLSGKTQSAFASMLGLLERGRMKIVLDDSKVEAAPVRPSRTDEDTHANSEKINFPVGPAVVFATTMFMFGMQYSSLLTLPSKKSEKGAETGKGLQVATSQKTEEGQRDLNNAMSTESMSPSRAVYAASSAAHPESKSDQHQPAQPQSPMQLPATPFISNNPNSIPYKPGSPRIPAHPVTSPFEVTNVHFDMSDLEVVSSLSSLESALSPADTGLSDRTHASGVLAFDPPSGEHCTLPKLIFNMQVDDSEDAWEKQGGYGRVKKGVYTNEKGERKVVAVKYVDALAPERARLALKNEWEVLGKVPIHPNIVLALGAKLNADGTDDIYLVEELMHTNLSDLLNSQSEETALSFRELIKIFKGVILGLGHLHRHNVVHYDLKPQNILLDKQLRAKIADFGSSRLRLGHSVSVSWGAGTFGYLPPECFAKLLGSDSDLQRAKSGERFRVLKDRIDVYSFGVVLWECLSGVRNAVEFSSFSWASASSVDEGMDGVECRRFELGGWCPEVLRKLVMDCVHTDSHERPSCTEIYSRLGGIESTADWLDWKPKILQTEQA